MSVCSSATADSPFQSNPLACCRVALSRDPRIRTGHLTLDIETLQLLFQRGLDPNTAWGDRDFSFWWQLLITMNSRHLRGLMTQNDRDVIKCSIDYGADQQAVLEVYSRSRVNTTPAADILATVLPQEQLFLFQNAVAS